MYVTNQLIRVYVITVRSPSSCTYRHNNITPKLFAIQGEQVGTYINIVLQLKPKYFFFQFTETAHTISFVR